MSKAWVYQDPKQVKKHGEEKASWYVGWLEPDGARKCKSCGPGEEGQRNAEKVRKRLEAQLLEGTYQKDLKKTWDEFKEEYDRLVLSGLSLRGRQASLESLANFRDFLRTGVQGSERPRTIREGCPGRLA